MGVAQIFQGLSYKVCSITLPIFSHLDYLFQFLGPPLYQHHQLVAIQRGHMRFICMLVWATGNGHYLGSLSVSHVIFCRNTCPIPQSDPKNKLWVYAEILVKKFTGLWLTFKSALTLGLNHFGLSL